MPLPGRPQPDPAASPSLNAEAAPPVPASVELEPGERPLLGERFGYSLLAFQLRTELLLTNRHLHVQHPVTVLGLIRLGVRHTAFALRSVARVGTSTHVSMSALLLTVLGAWLAVTGFRTAGMAAYGVIWLIFTAVFALWVPRQSIDVRDSAGGLSRYWVSILQRHRARELAGRLSELLADGDAEDAGDHDPDDVAGALARLVRLRELDLISAEEYEARRATILEER